MCPSKPSDSAMARYRSAKPAGRVIAAGTSQQGAQPQQRDFAHRRTVVCPQVRQPVDRLLGLRPDRPRRHAPAASPPERQSPQTPYPSRPAWCSSSTAWRITGMAASRSPRLALSRAAHKSTTGSMKRARSRSQMSRVCIISFQPAVTVGRGVPIQQRNSQRVRGQAQCDGSLLDLRRSAPPPRSRAPRSHRPEAPRTVSRNRRSR